MPLVEVSYRPGVAGDVLLRLAEVLPHAVSLAVECPEEPYDGALRPGDVEILFRRREALDRSGVDVLVEVRSKWFASRAETMQRRTDELYRAMVEATGSHSVGVYLSLPVAAWAQGERTGS